MASTVLGQTEVRNQEQHVDYLHAWSGPEYLDLHLVISQECSRKLVGSRASGCAVWAVGNVSSDLICCATMPASKFVINSYLSHLCNHMHSECIPPN